MVIRGIPAHSEGILTDRGSWKTSRGARASCESEDESDIDDGPGPAVRALIAAFRTRALAMHANSVY